MTPFKDGQKVLCIRGYKDIVIRGQSYIIEAVLGFEENMTLKVKGIYWDPKRFRIFFDPSDVERASYRLLEEMKGNAPI